jgi:hypothetical protein
MEFQDAIRGFKVGKAPGPNGLLNWALKLFPQRAISFLVAIFKAAFLAQYFPPVWKHGRVISILKPGKDPSLPSSYRPINLIDTIGKLFENILLCMIITDVSGGGLLRDEQFGFRPKHSTNFQVDRLVERVTGNFGEKRLTGAIFLDVAKAFDNVRVDGLLLKLTALNFPCYLVKIIFSYLHNGVFEAAHLTGTSTRRHMHAGISQGGLFSPVLFSLYVNDMPVPSRHLELAMYAEDTAFIGMSRKSALLIRYLEIYLRDLERWLRERIFAINVSKSNAKLFAQSAWRIFLPRTIHFLGLKIEWVDTSRYLGLTLDACQTWLPCTVQVRKKASQRLGVLVFLLNKRIGFSLRNGVLLYKQLIRPTMGYAYQIWRCAASSYVEQLQALQSKCLRIATVAPWYISSRQIHEDLGLPFFEEHTRALTESYDSKLAGVWNPLVRQIGRYLR